MDVNDLKNNLSPTQATAGMRRLGSAVLDRVAPDDARHALKFDTISGVLAGLYTGAVFPFLGKIARDNLHASVTLIALMAAAPCIGPLLSPVWASQMSGKNKMSFAVWSYSAGRVLLLAMALIYHAWAFVIITSLVQIVASIATPAYSTLMKEIYPDRVRGHCMGIVRVGVQAATFFVTLVAGKFLDSDVFAFHWVFPVAGLLGVASAQVFGRIKAQPIDGDSDYKPVIWDSFRVLKENPQYRVFAIGVFCCGIGNLVAGPAVTLHQVDNLHIRSENIAVLVNVSSATAILFYFVWGKFLDWRGPLKTVWVNMLISALIPLVYFLARDWHTLLIAAVVGGIANPGIDLSYLNSTLQFADDDKIPQYQSIHSFLFGVRGTLAPFIGAFMITFCDTRLNPALHPPWAEAAKHAPWGGAATAAWVGAAESAGGTYVAPVFLVAIALILAGAMIQILGVKVRYDRPK